MVCHFLFMQEDTPMNPLARDEYVGPDNDDWLDDFAGPDEEGC